MSNLVRLLMTRNFILAASVLIALLGWFGCDQGIEPKPFEPTGISGVVTFVNWEVVDTTYDIRIVVFTRFPPEDVINEVIDGNAIVHPPLITGGALVEEGADSVEYFFEGPAGTYPYLAIAHQFGPNLFKDWAPVGQYDLDSDPSIPSPVIVRPGETTKEINVHVDFENPPPAP